MYHVDTPALQNPMEENGPRKQQPDVMERLLKQWQTKVKNKRMEKYIPSK